MSLTQKPTLRELGLVAEKTYFMKVTHTRAFKRGAVIKLVTSDESTTLAPTVKNVNTGATGKVPVECIDGVTSVKSIKGPTKARTEITFENLEVGDKLLPKGEGGTQISVIDFGQKRNIVFLGDPKLGGTTSWNRMDSVKENYDIVQPTPPTKMTLEEIEKLVGGKVEIV